MQPLNHDMDELMRRAAESYPVKPLGADWDKVAQQLEATETKPLAGAQYGGLKKLLLLLPFILASFVCDKFFTVKWGRLQTLEAAANSPVTGKSTNDETTAKDVKKQASVATKKRTELKSGTIKTRQERQNINTEETKITERHDLRKQHQQRSTIGGSSELPFAPGKELTYDLLDAQRLTIEPVLHKVRHITLAEKQQLERTGKKGKKNEDGPSEKAYVSLLMGPDFSRVRSQKVNPAGYSIGFLAGYNFSKRWGVEGGVFWDKKNYYSKGEYFKTDKIYLPRHSTVIMVDGYCAMFEIPLNIRYKFLQNRRTVLAASVGASTYLMQDEDYDYVYRRYNEDYAGNAKYKRASQDWFSIANIGLSYEHQLGTLTKIRVEPYMKMPLKGVGIGSMPLHSTGLMIGITRTIQ